MAQVAKSITRYCNFFRRQGAASVLDYGAGTLRNAKFMAQQGFTVFVADLPELAELQRRSPYAYAFAGIYDADQLASTSLGVDLVLSTYVFNIISRSTEQQIYLRNILGNLRKGGYLLMEVRCRRIGECGSGCSHCFKCPDCAKTYTHEELDDLLLPLGFARVSHYYCSHALAAVYRLD